MSELYFEARGKRFIINRPVLMGILNVTPDSFSDGGKYYDTGEAVEHAREMIESGADIIDIGGESSRPKAEQVSEKEEKNRVIAVVKAVAKEFPCTMISVDTCKSGVAEMAVDEGACMINDITALRYDKNMAGIAAKYKTSVVLMHMLGNPRTMQNDPVYNNVIEDIVSFLKERIEFSVEAGINQNAVIVDPGIGFGKTLEHNLEIIKNIRRFAETGRPVMVGLSRKSFMGKVTGSPVTGRLMETAAMTAFALKGGALIHRVHDIAEMKRLCDMVWEFCGKEIPCNAP